MAGVMTSRENVSAMIRWAMATICG